MLPGSRYISLSGRYIIFRIHLSIYQCRSSRAKRLYGATQHGYGHNTSHALILTVRYSNTTKLNLTKNRYRANAAYPRIVKELAPSPERKILWKWGHLPHKYRAFCKSSKLNIQVSIMNQILKSNGLIKFWIIFSVNSKNNT